MHPLPNTTPQIGIFFPIFAYNGLKDKSEIFTHHAEEGIEI